MYSVELINNKKMLFLLSYVILSTYFSHSTRYTGFASRLSRALDISSICSQMEPRSPSLSSLIPIGDCRPFFAINHIPDGSSLLRQDARKDARCGKQRLDYSKGVYNNREVATGPVNSVCTTRSAAFVMTN